jgi:hypothetical protein
MEKERFGRRDFLNTVIVGSYAITGAYAAARLRPFVGLLTKPEIGSITPEDFNAVIDCQDTNIFLTGENDAGHKRVKVDKDRFSQALYDVARYMLPEDGPERVYALLANKHFKVVLTPFKAEPTIIGDKAFETVGEYFHYSQYGPRINFYEGFLQKYRDVQRKTDVRGQTAWDQNVWHEIVHFLQDVKNPFGDMIGYGIFKAGQTGSRLQLWPTPDIQLTPDEIEAREVAATIADTKYKEYLAGNDPEAWPFGKFLIFEDIG